MLYDADSVRVTDAALTRYRSAAYYANLSYRETPLSPLSLSSAAI